MKNKMIVLCLLTLSLVAVGKLSLDYVKPNSTRVIEANNNRPISNVANQQVKPEEVLFRSGNWLMSEIIPSAQAAKSIALDEEREMDDGIQSERGIQEKVALLDAKEAALNERETEVKDAEKRAANKIASLEALQVRIQNLLQQEESIKDKKIKRLTSVYEGMKADKAAPVIAQMDLKIVVKMFLRMNEKQVGKILSFLPPQQAVVISQALTKRIASVSK
ncbi:MAG: hypothetical protein R8M14_00985 [Ghiorsea sp.]